MTESNPPGAAFARSAFRDMARIRAVEQGLLALFSEGFVRGTVHTCLGQEAIPVGIAAALDRTRDVVCSNHRGHGHFLAWCGDAPGLVAEIMGLESGVCRGIGGSQHLHVPGFYSNGILGGMLGVATGMAFAARERGEGGIACAFLGDGALGEGLVYEALNMAALWKLPLLAVVEHNQYAQSTPWQLEHSAPVHLRPRAFGLEAVQVDGNDALAVLEAARPLVAALREGRGPAVLVCDTYRVGPHSKGDDDRDPAEIARARERDPIDREAARVGDAAWCAGSRREVEDEVASLVARLKREAGR